MIIVKLMGGLGNQMFQYATGRALAIHNNEKLILCTGFYENQEGCTVRKFELDIFNIKAEIPSASDMKVIYKKYFVDTVINKIKRKLDFKKNEIIYNEKSFLFDFDIFNIKKNLYLNGYFQSEKYFKNIRNILLEDFLPREYLDLKHKKMLTNICESNSVSIHIRRGDYIVNQFHGLCSLDYYKEAIGYIKKAIKNPVFFIFSDDIEWVKNNLLITEQTEYVSNMNIYQDYEEMYLMSKCKHNIIANSSFSWWAAWLNQNSKKIIIAPKRWFNEESISTCDLIPDNWSKL